MLIGEWPARAQITREVNIYKSRNTVVQKYWIFAGEVAWAVTWGWGWWNLINDPDVTLALTWNRKIEPWRCPKAPNKAFKSNSFKRNERKRRVKKKKSQLTWTNTSCRGGPHNHDIIIGMKLHFPRHRDAPMLTCGGSF